MSFATINFSTVSTTYGGLADAIEDCSLTLRSLNGWWEVPPYSTWDLGNKFACSQSTLVGRRSNDTSEKPHTLPTVIPTLYSMQSSAAESNARVSFSMPVAAEEVPTSVISTTDFGTGVGDEMGRAYRMHTLLNNPEILQKYHEAAKLADDPEVQFEFAKQLLLCGSTDMASDAQLLESESANSQMVREGVFWIMRLATKRRHKSACFLVGRWFELGKYGCKASKRKALKYYSLAAKECHTAAYYHMGAVLESQGKIRKARECFEQASKRGFSLATYRLGMAYLSGALGVTADFSMACSFLRESLFHASHPVADAGYNLAVALIQLPSFNRNSVSEPHLYLKRAWMLGHSDAGALLRDILP
ncbi:hypothetical protein GGI25_003482 [Coemansia spiralis]|uniref:Uncharacterized protein n=2 Tax=Coemansia TaxID=4863 RepID=A0A9W8G215_9FUNG|nr:hypothetical protein BX070DRAFT_253116 [Coemansia spiralis]KAJ1991498.1 hypothetical protein EDC05_003422 [Coemansia umbellata]KAJ2621546.1 hypothetical protein GGI26_004009 [Coemansia sp. RSA 1358]KAJ2676730.1 hypothetical protein GGI25_003482 [Coemansia spiralis]